LAIYSSIVAEKFGRVNMVLCFFKGKAGEKTIENEQRKRKEK